MLALKYLKKKKKALLNIQDKTVLFPCHNLSCLVLEFAFAVACHPVVFVCKGTEKLPNCLQNIMLSDCFKILIFTWKNLKTQKQWLKPMNVFYHQVHRNMKYKNIWFYIQWEEGILEVILSDFQPRIFNVKIIHIDKSKTLNEKGGTLHTVTLLFYHIPYDTSYYLSDIMKCSLGRKKKNFSHY